MSNKKRGLLAVFILIGITGSGRNANSDPHRIIRFTFPLCRESNGDDRRVRQADCRRADHCSRWRNNFNAIHSASWNYRYIDHSSGRRLDHTDNRYTHQCNLGSNDSNHSEWPHLNTHAPRRPTCFVYFAGWRISLLYCPPLQC